MVLFLFHHEEVEVEMLSDFTPGYLAPHPRSWLPLTTP